MPWYAAGAAAIAAPGIISAIRSGKKIFPDTYAFKLWQQAQNNQGWRDAANEKFNVDPSLFQYDTNIQNQLQGLGQQLANTQINAQQVGGGLAGQNFQAGTNALNESLGAARSYAGSPLVSALAQKQGLAQALAQQRAASVSGPMQFNQALAQRNAARAGSNLYAQQIQQGQLAQAQEQLARQAFLAQALQTGGTAIGNIGQQVQAGQIANAENALTADKLNLYGKTSAADLYGNLGNQLANLNLAKNSALYNAFVQSQNARTAYGHDQANSALGMLGDFVGYNGGQNNGQLLGAAGVNAGAALLAQSLGQWGGVGGGGGGAATNAIDTATGASGGFNLGNYGSQLSNPANNPAFSGLFPK